MAALNNYSIQGRLLSLLRYDTTPIIAIVGKVLPILTNAIYNNQPISLIFAKLHRINRII